MGSKRDAGDTKELHQKERFKVEIIKPFVISRGAFDVTCDENVSGLAPSEINRNISIFFF